MLWAFFKSKDTVTTQFSKILICSFYCPPSVRKKKQKQLIEHINGTLQMIQSQYPNIGIICGGDRNSLDISEILLCNQELKQINTQPTRKGKVLDILLTNLYKYYNDPVTLLPVQCDNPDYGRPSDQ